MLSGITMILAGAIWVFVAVYKGSKHPVWGRILFGIVGMALIYLGIWNIPMAHAHTHAWFVDSTWYQGDVQFCTWVCTTGGYEEHFVTTNGRPTCAWPR